jgi:fucose permease
MFPAIVVITTNLLPKHLHVTAVGFAAAFGGSGGATFPFAIGDLQTHDLDARQYKKGG